MGIDYGRRRLGVAVSDPTRTLASPHRVVENDDDPTEPPEELLALVAEIDPDVVVLGIPLRMDGTEGEMARESRRFGERLAERTGREVATRDERLTSEGARRALRESGAPRSVRRRKGSTDMAAATIILQGYLDASP